MDPVVKVSGEISKKRLEEALFSDEPLSFLLENGEEIEVHVTALAHEAIGEDAHGKWGKAISELFEDESLQSGDCWLIMGLTPRVQNRKFVVYTLYSLECDKGMLRRVQGVREPLAPGEPGLGTIETLTLEPMVRWHDLATAS